jgi:hypothetical protein
MAKHSTEKMGSKTGKLKIHGGFKAMEAVKKGSEKQPERKK